MKERRDKPADGAIYMYWNVDAGLLFEII